MPMCNAKFHDRQTNTHTHTHTHTHNNGLTHTLTQHWADPETIFIVIQPHVMTGSGCRMGVELNQKQYIIKGLTHGMDLYLLLDKALHVSLH